MSELLHFLPTTKPLCTKKFFSASYFPSVFSKSNLLTFPSLFFYIFKILDLSTFSYIQHFLHLSTFQHTFFHFLSHCHFNIHFIFFPFFHFIIFSAFIHFYSFSLSKLTNIFISIYFFYFTFKVNFRPWSFIYFLWIHHSHLLLYIFMATIS